RIYAFTLSGAVGGLAGGIFVHTPVGGPQPSQLLDLLVSIEVIVATIVGGIGTIIGAAIGGLFFHLFSDWLARSEYVIPVVEVTVGEANFLVFALLTLLILYYAPGGMLRWGIDAGESVRRIRRGEPPAGGLEERSVVEQIADRYREELPFIADERRDYRPRRGRDDRNAERRRGDR
ncbi:MAG: ABC transporter permease subunit, partial [Halobacteriota archaeon]